MLIIIRMDDDSIFMQTLKVRLDDFLENVDVGALTMVSSSF